MVYETTTPRISFIREYHTISPAHRKFSLLCFSSGNTNYTKSREKRRKNKLQKTLYEFTNVHTYFPVERVDGCCGCCAAGATLYSTVWCNYDEEEDSEWICIQTTLTSSFCSQWSHIIIRHKVASWIHSKFSHKVSKNGIKLSFQFEHFS